MCGLSLAPFLLYLVPVIIHSLIHQTVIFCCVPGIILAIGLHPGKHNTNLPSSWNLYSCCRGRGMRIKYTSVNCLLCCYCFCAILSCVQLFVTPWTVACQASLEPGILQARILGWVAIPFSKGSSQPRGQTQVSCTAGRFFPI